MQLDLLGGAHQHQLDPGGGTTFRFTLRGTTDVVQNS
jgi:hypothetical protein